MRPTTKEEWVERLAHLETLNIQRSDEMRRSISEGINHRIEAAGAAALDCAQRIAEAKKAIADYV